MKKVLLTILLLLGFAFLNVNAQTSKSNTQEVSIYSDTNYLKANLHLFNAVITLDEIYFSENQKAESKKLLPALKYSIDEAKRMYQSVKAKSYPETDFKTFEINVLTLEKCYLLLKDNDESCVIFP
ncbi:MAG: hypothetical protein KL787_03405 [Taibaiella sp.]|nr:hypothetical protein [Taibaiella sp.]